MVSNEHAGAQPTGTRASGGDNEAAAHIKIHVLHCGRVCVSKFLPFGGEGCSLIKASGVFGKEGDRVWLPVSAYLIEHPHGLLLVDTGWERAMSPRGAFDAHAQVASLGSRLLYKTNQGMVEPGKTVGEQLARMGITARDLDYVLLTHLDCDHANGLSEVRDARRILVSADELTFASRFPNNAVRYQKRWWSGVNLQTFAWSGTEGPAGKSHDLFEVGSLALVNIPGHAEGLFAVKVTGADGRFALLFSDGGYATRSWQEMVLPGIASDRAQQRRSLAWIRQESLRPECVESIANHDPDVQPHVIEL